MCKVKFELLLKKIEKLEKKRNYHRNKNSEQSFKSKRSKEESNRISFHLHCPANTKSELKMYPSTVEAVHRRENADVIERIVKSCRLSQLNFDCLDEIFQYLFTNDLLHLCQINPMVCDAIKERAIGKHHIDFTAWNQLWGTETIFTEFGAKIRSMAIHEWDFSQAEAADSTTGDQPINQFLSMLIKHCKPNRIQELSLNFDCHGINQTQLNEARPYFGQLEKIIFASTDGRHPNTDLHEQLLTTMIDSAKQLSAIQLESTTSSGNWLRLAHMANVENLALVNSLVDDDQKWHQYLTNQPKLTSFAWVHSTNPNVRLCENVARYCSELERFFDVQVCIDDDQYFQRDFVMSRYNYFASFQNLKCAQITAYTESGRDLIGAFMAMARRNTVERLGINFLQNPTIKYTLDDMDYAAQEYPEIQSLQSLAIENCTSCNFWNGILVNFLKATMNLKELSISGCDRINSIQLTCIALAPSKLDVLNINQLIVADLPLAMKSISVGRAKNNNSNTLTVVINSEQSGQLKGREFCNIQFEVIGQE